MKASPWAHTTSDRDRRNLAVQLLSKKGGPSKHLRRLLGVNAGNWKAMIANPRFNAASSSAPRSETETRAAIMVDTGQFNPVGASGIYTHSFVTDTTPRVLDLSNPATLRNLNRTIFDSENPADCVTLMIRSTSAMFKNGACGWMILGDIPPQAMALLQMLLPGSHWSQVCWDRPFDVSTPAATLARLCKLHHALSRRREDCEKVSRAIVAMVSHALELRNNSSKEGRIRTSKAHQLERLAPSARWADISTLVDESLLASTDLSKEALARFITLDQETPIVGYGDAPVDGFTMEQLHHSLPTGLNPNSTNPAESYHHFKELRDLPAIAATAALPGEEFQTQVREVLKELAEDARKNGKVARWDQRARHQMSDLLVEIGKLLGGGLALESRHAASAASSLRFVALHPRTAVRPATSSPPFVLPPTRTTNSTIPIDLWPLFLAIRTAACHAGLSRNIRNLRQLKPSNPDSAMPIQELPLHLEAQSLTDAVLALAAAFPSSLLISAVAADLPEGIASLATETIQTILASDSKLPAKRRGKLRANLAIVQEIAAPLMAEAFLHLALVHLRAQRDRHPAGFKLNIDLEDFAHFTESLGKHFMSKVVPRESRTRESRKKSTDQTTTSLTEDYACKADDVDMVTPLVKMVAGKKISAIQAAETLQHSIEERDGDQDFHMEELQGQLLEVQTERTSEGKPRFNPCERYAAREILSLLQ